MTNVVSFNRNGEYILGRASANRAEGRLLEALKLLRRVVEVEPGSVSGWMETAQTLCEMGRFEQSNRVLALMLSVPGAPNDCYFGMCCNFMGLGDYRAAFGAMVNLIALDPQALSREDVIEAFRNILRARIGQIYSERANQRVEGLCERAFGHLLAGRADTALYLASRAYEFDPFNFEAARAYCRALVAAGDLQKARNVINKAMAREDRDMETQVEAIRVYALTGDRDKARAVAQRLLAEPHPMGEELLLCLKAACLSGEDEAVSVTAAKALRQSPFDTQLFHICAVNRVRLARPVEQAVSFWTRANSIDPDDVVIRYYLKTARSGELSKDISYDYELPPSERERLLTLLKRALPCPDGELTERYRADSDLRDACQWAIFSTDDRAALARDVLVRVDDARAKRVLGESTIGNFKRSFHSVKFGKQTNVSHMANGCVIVPPRRVRAVTLAGCAFHEYFGGNNILRLYEALSPTMRVEGIKEFDDSRALAAVLAYTALKAKGAALVMRDVAERLNCPLRRAKRCLKAYNAAEVTNEDS